MNLNKSKILGTLSIIFIIYTIIIMTLFYLKFSKETSTQIDLVKLDHSYFLYEYGYTDTFTYQKSYSYKLLNILKTNTNFTDSDRIALAKKGFYSGIYSDQTSRIYRANNQYIVDKYNQIFLYLNSEIISDSKKYEYAKLISNAFVSLTSLYCDSTYNHTKLCLEIIKTVIQPYKYYIYNLPSGYYYIPSVLNKNSIQLIVNELNKNVKLHWSLINEYKYWHNNLIKQVFVCFIKYIVLPCVVILFSLGFIMYFPLRKILKKVIKFYSN